MLNATAIGCSLKQEHHPLIDQDPPDLDWFEVHSENYFALDGVDVKALLKIRQNYEISLHGIGLSLGSVGELSQSHLKSLKALMEKVDPWVVSEHISWSQIDGTHFNDLLPLPYTEESLDVLCTHIDQTQDYLGRRILVENPSAYVSFAESTLSEPAFINEVIRRTGCGMLLDVNNIFVSTQNMNTSAEMYLQELEGRGVRQIHLAGPSEVTKEGHAYLIDTHSTPVRPEVWELYDKVMAQLGPVPTMVEWDSDLPPFKDLVAEAQKARSIMEKYQPLLKKAG